MFDSKKAKTRTWLLQTLFFFFPLHLRFDERFCSKDKKTSTLTDARGANKPPPQSMDEQLKIEPSTKPSFVPSQQPVRHKMGTDGQLFRISWLFKCSAPTQHLKDS